MYICFLGHILICKGEARFLSRLNNFSEMQFPVLPFLTCLVPKREAPMDIWFMLEEADGCRKKDSPNSKIHTQRLFLLPIVKHLTEVWHILPYLNSWKQDPKIWAALSPPCSVEGAIWQKAHNASGPLTAQPPAPFKGPGHDLVCDSDFFFLSF